MRTDIKVTYDEYCALPEGPPRYQLIDGDLVMSPSANLRHQRILVRLAAALETFVEAKSLGTIAVAPLDVVLSDVTVLQPDVLFVSEKNSNILRKEGVFGAPDLCVEILSPSNRRFDLDIKRHLYARHGVLEYWIIDPDDNTLSCFRLQEDAERPAQIHDSSSKVTSSLLPGFELALNRIFAK